MLFNKVSVKVALVCEIGMMMMMMIMVMTKDYRLGDIKLNQIKSYNLV